MGKIYASFDDWKKSGRFIKKGESSSAITHDGVHLFEKSQTDFYKKEIKTIQTVAKQQQDEEPERKTVYFADGSGYLEAGGPCGPLYFDVNGNI